MKKFTLATLFALATTPAVADPFMTSPVYTKQDPHWNTIYFGMSGSYSELDTPEASSGGVGMQLGRLWQFGDVVVGGEIGANPIGESFDDNITEDLGVQTGGWMSVNGRIGYSFGHVQPYATVGAKFINFDYHGKSYSDTGLIYGLGLDTTFNNEIIIGTLISKTVADDFDGSGLDYEETKISLRVSIRP